MVQTLEEQIRLSGKGEDSKAHSWMNALFRVLTKCYSLLWEDLWLIEISTEGHSEKINECYSECKEEEQAVRDELAKDTSKDIDSSLYQKFKQVAQHNITEIRKLYKVIEDEKNEVRDQIIQSFE